MSPKAIRDIWNRRTWTQETRHLWIEGESQFIRRKTQPAAVSHITEPLPLATPTPSKPEFHDDSKKKTKEESISNEIRKDYPKDGTNSHPKASAATMTSDLPAKSRKGSDTIRPTTETALQPFIQNLFIRQSDHQNIEQLTTACPLPGSWRPPPALPTTIPPIQPFFARGEPEPQALAACTAHFGGLPTPSGPAAAAAAAAAANTWRRGYYATETPPPPPPPPHGMADDPFHSDWPHW